MRHPFLVVPLLGVALVLCGFRFLPGGAPDGMKGRIRLEPAGLVVGEPFAFVIEIEVPEGNGIEGLQFGGLPDPSSAPVEFGDAENLADGTGASKDKVLKRFRLPGRFTAPFSGEFHPVATGMAVARRQSGGFSYSSSSSFQTRLGSVRVEAGPLPDAGRPVNFSGAVGRDFRMTQKLVPDRIRPGDLVTASYLLEFDGYCPSNAVPRIEHLARTFKAYLPQESERKPNRVVWTQVLVPRTTAATNTALVSLGYYNVETRRYEIAMAAPRPLVFVSDEAAATTNTVVAVDAAAGPRPAQGASSTGLVILRFGPSDRSPVVLTLPAGAAPTRETAREGAWRRLESPRGSGWTR